MVEEDRAWVSPGEAREETRVRNSPEEAERPTPSPVRIGVALQGLSAVPLMFLGIGIYRVYIELLFLKPVYDLPANVSAGHNPYDIAMVVVLLSCAIFSRRLVPLFRRRWALWGAVGLMIVGAVAEYVSFFEPGAAGLLAYPAAITAGAGTALMILLWSELFGCLSPLRVALYYSLSLIFGAVLIWIGWGFSPIYLAVYTSAMPIVSLLCLRASYRRIPPGELPSTNWGRFSFPWKPTLLMAAYALAFGLHEQEAYATSGAHSSIGCVIVAAIVVVGVLWRSERFDFSILYRVGMPLMVGGLLLAPLLTGSNSRFSNECIIASYTAFSILIMIILSSMSYHWGVGAVWLFGIERGVRALAMELGRAVTSTVTASGIDTGSQALLFDAVTIALVVVVTMLLIGERDIASAWGVKLVDGADGGESAGRGRLTRRCAQLQHEYNLTQREGEVLVLLAQRKSITEVERELFIARGTAKAHIYHIYTKLDIHARGELFALLGIEAVADDTGEAEE